MLAPATRIAIGLAAPVRLATDDGSPKMPLPITPLVTAAVNAHRPIARIRRGGVATPACASAAVCISLPGEVYRI